ncbi:MAG: hypothetical protein ACHQ4H_02495 [Ktedonobacterales bacterium]
MTNHGPNDIHAAARRVRASDDYINSPEEEQALGLPAGETAEQIAAEGELKVTRPEVRAVDRALHTLDWSGGLHRDDIKARWHDFPLGIYLRLPASKRFDSPEAVLDECGLSGSRAEGMFMGPHPDFPERASVADGGPPGWGEQQAIYPVGSQIDGGSAEDRDGLLPGDTGDTGASKPKSSK